VATTAELKIPVSVDGRTTVATFGEIEAAAKKAAAAAADVGRGSTGKADAEFEQRTARLAIQGIEDRKERQLAATRLTLEAEVSAINQIIARRQALGELTERQAQQQREYVRQLAAEARAAQATPDPANREGGRSNSAAVNANGALTSLAQGLQDASYARNFGEAVRYAGNNAQQFVTQLGYVAAAARTAGTSVRAELVGALTGGGGLILAFTAALAILPAVINYLNREEEAQRRAADAAREHSAAIRDQIRELRSLSGARAASAILNQRQTLEETEAALANLRVQQARAGDAAVLAARTARLNQPYVERQSRTTVDSATEARERAALLREQQVTQLLRDQETSRNGIAEAERRGQRDLGTRLGLLEAEAETLGNTGANAARLLQVNQEIREIRDTQAQRLQTGQYDPATIERQAEIAARRARTAAERQARRDAHVAREQAALRADLAVAATRQGVAREIAAAAKLRDERLVIARQDATLRLAVEAAYQRDVSRIREADERARTDRQIAALEQVAQARQQIDAAIGVGQDELARRRIAAIQAEAVVAAGIAADRLKQTDQIEASVSDLVALIQRGTLADAEAFAARAGETEELQRVVALLLERLNLEGEITGRVRERQIDEDRRRREEASQDRDLKIRREEARRRIESGGRGGSRTQANVARDELEGARQELERIDAALRAAAGAGAEVVVSETGAVQVIADGVAQTGELIDGLAQDRIESANRVKEAEVKASEAAADEVEASYERRRDAARRFADEAVQAIVNAFDYERRYTDTEIELQRERYRQELADLDERLRTEGGMRRETDLERRRLLEEQADFEKEVEADRASFLERSARNISEVILQEIQRQVAAAIAAAAVRAALGILTGGGIFAIPAFGFASGGQVVGPGSGTSDSVVARLSNGEHVLTAEEVDRMGGHAAVYRLRSLALSGALPAFATGGPVSYDLTPPPIPRVFSQTGGVSAAFDLSPLSDQIERLTRRVDAQTVALDTAVRDGADRTSKSVGDPDAARRITRTSRARTQQVQTRGTRRSL